LTFSNNNKKTVSSFFESFMFSQRERENDKTKTTNTKKINNRGWDDDLALLGALWRTEREMRAGVLHAFAVFLFSECKEKKLKESREIEREKIIEKVSLLHLLCFPFGL
jgi:hypothetical protein